MKLIISTLNWNGKDKLDKLYKNFTKSLKDIDYQWVIKDNGSIDGSVDLIKSWNNDNINLIEYKHNNDNFSQGVNLCIKEASPKNDDFILLLNNDVVFNDIISIKKMLEFMKDDSVGIVGAKLLNQQKLINHAGVVFVKGIELPTHHRAGKNDDKFSSQNRYFQAITGAVMLTRASIFNEVGGMEEKLRWSFDDIDFCMSVSKVLKKKIVYCGNTDIFHEESATLKKNPVNKLFMQHNINVFKSKWQGKYDIDKDLYEKNANYNLCGNK